MIIAEIGTSHSGSLTKAFELIDTAVDSGADAVKFQWVYADEILHPNTGFVNLPTGNIRLYDRFKELEVSKSFYEQTLNYAHKKGVKFICSPFGLKSLSELLDINPDAIKIASPELNHFPMLNALSERRKNQQKKIDVIISSGVSTLSDIEKALQILGYENVSLLHCITSYPAPETEYNVRLVKNLHNIFGIETGISDHSLDPVLVPCLSTAMGGTIIEKHITLSKTTDGLDDPVALTKEQFTAMTQAVHQCETVLSHYGNERGVLEIIKQMESQYGDEKVKAVLGSGVKTLAPSEKNNYGKTNRSLHYLKSLRAGSKIKDSDIGTLRTEKILTSGISSEFLPILLNKTLSSDVKNGDGVRLEDFLF